MMLGRRLIIFPATALRRHFYIGRGGNLPSSSYVNLFLSERTAWYSSPAAVPAAVNNA